MKVCKDCKHFNSYTLSLTCSAPSNGIDAVNGGIKRYWCHTSRTSSDLCGYNGRYFEQKDAEPIKPVSWWRKLIGLRS